jgi:hypothetical protein
MNKECSCDSCKMACMHRPGFFRREQIEPLAKALNITVKELVHKHLQVDFYSGLYINPEGKSVYLDDVMMLVPRLKGHPGASQIDQDPRGVCHWFVKGRCQIHKKGKPAECAGLVHNDKDDYDTIDRAEVVSTWVGHEEFIEEITDDCFVPHNINSMSYLMMGFRPYCPDPDQPDPYADKST